MNANKQKHEIERVLTVFKPYLAKADFMDYLWCDKLQHYVFLFIDHTRSSIEESELVDSADMVCERVYWEMSNDILLDHNCEGPIGDAPKIIQDEFCKKVQPYDSQLPEYHALLEHMLHAPSTRDS